MGIVVDNMDFNDYTKEVANNIDFNSNFLVDVNKNFLITAKEKLVLDNYDIPYSSCNDLNEVIFLVEKAIEEYDSPEDLLEISDTLSERYYYTSVNK